jgi:hypothetical protein
MVSLSDFFFDEEEDDFFFFSFDDLSKSVILAMLGYFFAAGVPCV